jgi:hypothetical protein
MESKGRALRMIVAVSLLLALSGCVVVPVHHPYYYPYYHPYWR